MIANVTPFPLKAAIPPRTDLHPVVQRAVYDVDQAVVTFAQEILAVSDPSDAHRLARVLERLSLTLAAYADEARLREDALTRPQSEATCLVTEADYQRFWK